MKRAYAALRHPSRHAEARAKEGTAMPENSRSSGIWDSKECPPVDRLSARSDERPVSQRERRRTIVERTVRTSLLGAILPIAMLLSASGATSKQTSDVASVIADAMSAAPPYISQNATIVGRDMRVLRK